MLESCKLQPIAAVVIASVVLVTRYSTATVANLPASPLPGPAWNGGWFLDSRFCTKNMISEGTSRASLPYLVAHMS